MKINVSNKYILSVFFRCHQNLRAAWLYKNVHIFENWAFQINIRNVKIRPYFLGESRNSTQFMEPEG
jgi:hypothetical protein